MSLKYNSEKISENLSEDLQNIADHIYGKESERDTKHISEIYGSEKGDLVVVMDYDNYIGEYLNKIFSDFVEVSEQTYGCMIIGKEASKHDKVMVVFQKEPNEALRYFALYSIALGTPPTSAVPIGEDIYDVDESKPIEKISEDIHDALPENIDHYTIEDIKEIMNIEFNGDESDESSASSSAFDW